MMSLTMSSEAVYYTAFILGAIVSVFIIRVDLKHYGLLLLISGLVAIFLCYFFVQMSFYSFSNIPIHNFKVPLFSMLVTFPAGVMLGVRYSPRKWVWKIPFYWGLVHLGVLAEVLIKERTPIFQFNFEWDLWDSYTWWWIYFLLFEWIGGKIVPEQSRKPINEESFRYGRWAWLIFHVIVIITIFLAGFYLGKWKYE